MVEVISWNIEAITLMQKHSVLSLYFIEQRVVIIVRLKEVDR